MVVRFISESDGATLVFCGTNAQTAMLFVYPILLWKKLPLLFDRFS